MAGVLQDISEKQRMSGEIEQYIAQIKQSFFKTINAIIAISNIRDPYTVGHEQRVGEISLAIARQLGLDKHTREGIRVAGYLHDIGKI
ncbi:HD domain-containing phosphohydrolase, partial [Acinetobacter baumannii]